MADAKISQLPVASTPLAGTELVPVVQGGATEQTTVEAILTGTVPSGTANGVLYLDGSKVVTSGSALTFNGSTLATTGALTVDGNVTLGNASTDTVQVNGYMGVGGAAQSNNQLWVRGTIASGTFQTGIISYVTAASQATTRFSGIQSSPFVPDAAFTYTTVAALYGDNTTKGAAATITNQHGLYIVDQTQGTNNYGITSLVSSGTNKWNIYASGTANNAFAGNVRIGSTTAPTNALDVTGAMTVSGNVTLGDATTDTVQVNGYMGVGGAASSARGLLVTGSTMTGSTQIGLDSSVTGSATGTSLIVAVNGTPNTAAAAFTVTDLIGLRAGDVAKGAGSTITNKHGVYIADQTQGTNNFGITSLVSSGSNKWNIYASGTAANYFAGNVGIGITTASTNLEVAKGSEGLYLKVGGDNAANGRALTFTSSTTGGSNGALHTINASSSSGVIAFATNSTERLRIDSSGNLIAKPAAGTGAVFNEDGVDADFRVESDTNTHALFVEGSDGSVGIGTSSPAYKTTIVESNTGAASTLLAVHNSGIAADTEARIVLAGGNGLTTRHAYIGAINGGAGSGNPHSLVFATNSGSSTPAERLRITSVGNVSVGGTADRATTVGTAALNIFDGTAPVGTLANGVSIYSSAGEAYVMDAAGNATLFSPHDAETNEWIFKSKHTPTGKVLKIDVERLLRFVNDHFGLDAVQEFIET